MKQYILVSFLATAVTSVAYGADRNIPRGYYDSLDGLSGAALKTAVHQIVYPHTELSYTGLSKTFQQTDLYPNSKRWWDMYSNIPLYAPSFSGLNREHSLPKSWWGGLDTTPAYVDINHLYPSEMDANMAKSNYPLGMVDMTKTLTFDNGVTRVGVPVRQQGGGASRVFEPDDQYKGDFARTYFYMATCYQNLTWKYTYMLENNTYPTLNSWSRQMLMDWARADEVSQKEIDRNEAVYKLQSNRNPFIDFPDLFEYIWGSKFGEPFSLSEHLGGSSSDTTPYLITPVQGMTLDFSQVALGLTTTAKLHLKGQNLKAGQQVNLTIYDNASTDDADKFFLDGDKSRQQVAATAVNDADGMWVTITYRPTALGEHDTRLVVSGAGISGSVGIGLHGECLPYPSLSAPVATPAIDVTSTSYVATWQVTPDEVVDYYIVNRTIYGSNPSTQQLVAEENCLEIDDFTGNESYTVQAVRLAVKSLESNVIQVRPGAITGVDLGATFCVRNIGGAMLFSCSQVLDEVKIYDAAGRLLTTLLNVENNQVYPMVPGLYIVRPSGIKAAHKLTVTAE